MSDFSNELSPAQPKATTKCSDYDLQVWADAHHIKLTGPDLRAAFEDAQTWTCHTPAPAAKEVNNER